MRTLITILILATTATLIHAQQPSKPAHAEAAATSSEDAQTRQDLQRMKSLVQQMQTNLAFVTSTQGPLKHQFELEIEMWQLEIARLERRLDQKGADETKK